MIRSPDDGCDLNNDAKGDVHFDFAALYCSFQMSSQSYSTYAVPTNNNRPLDALLSMALSKIFGGPASAGPVSPERCYRPLFLNPSLLLSL